MCTIKSASFCSAFLLVGLSFVLGKRGDSLFPPYHTYDDDDVNENDDWICKNNDYCFHPDIIIVVAKKKKKDNHTRAAAVVRVLP
jgi:predicted nucleic acid-binding Zn finger protein